MRFLLAVFGFARLAMSHDAFSRNTRNQLKHALQDLTLGFVTTEDKGKKGSASARGKP